MNNRPFEIIFEDDDIVVINKLPYVVVNQADTVDEETVQSWFSTYLVNKNNNWQALVPEDFNPEYGTPEEIFEQRGGIVHRLDKETSGVLVLAKNPGALVNLLAQFKQRTTQKEYLCLTHGKFSLENDVIDVPIGRSSRDRKTFDTRIDGRAATTEYTVEKYFSRFDEGKWLTLFKESAIPHVNYHYSGNHKKYFKMYQGFSLVKCKPLTGRTHQIRVHMAHIQHPIVGDMTYSGKKRAKADELWCGRQFLHAYKLTLQHPRTRETMTFEAELPEDLLISLQCVA